MSTLTDTADLPASHPSRGGWIEIGYAFHLPPSVAGPTPHGVGGLKYIENVIISVAMIVPPLTGWVD